ncbi:Fc.00g116030.m01.CDS01 [Cosmosporella sp. VM-42]
MTIDVFKTALGNTRRIMWHLFAINVVIAVMDIGLLAIEYKNYYIWEQGIKVVVYAIKLKLEFAVLGELIRFIQHHDYTHPGDPSNTQQNTVGFLELSDNLPKKINKTATASDAREVLHLENVESSSGATAKTVPRGNIDDDEI